MDIFSQFGFWNTLTLFGYLALVLGVGVLFSGKQKTGTDFFLAGRNLPWLPVAMSMYASVTSASTYLVLPGKAYAENVSLFVAGFISPLLAPLLIFAVYPRYRRAGVTTSYEFIGRRFGRAARTATSVLFVLARLGWLGIVLYAPALALSVVAGWPLGVCILVLGVVTTLYTVMGGLSAVVWTDVIQFLILVGGAVLVFVLLCVRIPGGLGEIWSTAAETGRLDVFGAAPGAEGTVPFFFQMTAWSIAIHMGLNIFFEYGADQVTVQRLMAVRTDGGVMKAIAFNAVSDVLMISLLLLTGLGIHAFFLAFPGGVLPPADLSSDGILPFYIQHYLPPGIAGLVVTAILAAAMSSADSGMNSIATVLETDLFPLFRKRAVSDEHKILLARWVTLALGAGAIVCAFLMAAIGNILEGFSLVISLFNAPVLALFVFAFLSTEIRFRDWLLALGPALALTIWINFFTQINWSWRFAASFAAALLFTVLIHLFFRCIRAEKAPAAARE